MLFHRDKPRPTPLTSLGFWEALVQAEDDALHEVLDVTLLRAPHEHHPVVGEALRGRLLAQLGPVPQLQLHLHRALRGDRGSTVSTENTTWAGSARERGRPRAGIGLALQTAVIDGKAGTKIAPSTISYLFSA